MANVPSLKRLDVADYPGSPTWFPNLLLRLNSFISDVNNALDGNLTAPQNTNIGFHSTSFTTAANFDSRPQIEGVATLVGGTVTVTFAPFYAGEVILVTRKTPGAAPGFLSYTVTTGSMTVTSSNGADTGVIAWLAPGGTGLATWTQIKFPNPIKTRPVSVDISTITRTDGFVNGDAITCEWSLDGSNNIVIRWIAGLSPATPYNVTFRVM